MVTVAFQSDTVRIQEEAKRRIEKTAQKVARILGASDIECGVLFVGDKRMRELNKKHRNKNFPTDVLSFAMRDAEKEFPQFIHKNESEYIGEIIINLDFVREKAETPEEKIARILFLFTHGMLHLFQYDHQSEKEVRRMRNVEKRVLGKNTFYDHDDH